jgi:hypothetical protein
LGGIVTGAREKTTMMMGEQKVEEKLKVEKEMGK